MKISPSIVMLTTLCFSFCDLANGFQESSEKTLLKNGGFEKWQSGKPTHWNISVGATNGNGKSPESRVEEADGPALQLSGTGKTEVWKLVTQAVELDADTPYVLSVNARAVDVRRDGGQFDNCYVGIFLKRRDGQRIDQRIATVSTERFERYLMPFKTWGDISLGEVTVFLSKTGQLHVKDVALKKVSLSDSFDLLVADMDRNYSFFKHKHIDWKEVSDRYRKRGKAVKTPDELIDVISEMLAELKDIHTWIFHQGKKIYVTQSGFQPNYEFSIVDNDLKSKKQFGKFGMVGTTSDGFGYVRITSLAGINKRTIELMMRAIEDRFEAPGMILDLRRNGGGAEPIAAAIAGMFLEEPVEYARQKFRSGPDHGDFFETQPRILAPRKGRKFNSPIVCLIGPGAVSSAEGFAAMMKAIPHCTTIGKPTRGASGNPQPVNLADGIDVYYSRWMSLMPDGSPIEDVGVKPDQNVDHKPGSDRTYERATRILKQKT